jgi:lysyl-tRNA synthetase, class II
VALTTPTTGTPPGRHSRSNSRLRWVPAAAGWIVGVIATLSLLASISPLLKWLIHGPREFINDYLFNFPDTSFAWSFVLALLAAALTARKRIAWLLLLGNMLLAAVSRAVTPQPRTSARISGGSSTSSWPSCWS